MKRIGYFSKPGQKTPTYDPGLDVDCLACGEKLSLPVKTISFRVDDHRSYFYRLHKECATQENQEKIEGPLIDAIGEMIESGGSMQWGEA